MQLLLINHETKLTYTAPVTESVIEIRTAPPSQDDQTQLGYRLAVSPPTGVTNYRDGFGNRVELFNISAPHSEVVVRALSCVRVHRVPQSQRLATVSLSPEPSTDVEAVEYLLPSPQVDFTPAVRQFASGITIRDGAPLADAAEAVMRAVRDRLTYEKEVTAAHTRVSEALELGRGVCQDFAHLFLAAARLRGLPARYVSGYVHQPGEIATHAWVQVWAGTQLGWANLDPTHGLWVGSDHVVTAVGRDFADVPPNRGVWRGEAVESITVTVNVQPVERVPVELAEPISAPSWSATAVATRHRQDGLDQQARNRAFRQQQSQQQQTRH